MPTARHPVPPEIAALTLEEIAERYIGRFRDKVGDWEAFEDAKIEGYRRAQHRFIGAGGSGKHDDPNAIPPRGLTLPSVLVPRGCIGARASGEHDDPQATPPRASTLSIVLLPPGEANAAHTHEVEEVFFV